MRRYAPLTMAAFLILAGTVAWNYPVYALSKKINELSSGRVQVLNSSGSIWSGKAQLGLSDGQHIHALPAPLTWSLFTTQNGMWVGISIEHPILLEPVEVGWTRTGLLVSAGALRMPASWLNALGAPFNTIRPEGMLQANWAGYSPNDAIEISVKWVDAQSALANIRPLGEYELTLTGHLKNALQAQLKTNKGPLMIEGQGSWRAGQRFVFNGYAWAQERSKTALTGLLSQMGRQEGEKYRLGVF